MTNNIMIKNGGPRPPCRYAVRCCPLLFFGPNGVNAVNDRSRELVVFGCEGGLFSPEQGWVFQCHGLQELPHLFLVPVELGDAQARHRQGTVGYIINELHPAPVIAGDALVLADEELDTVDLLCSGLMPGDNSRGAAQAVPRGGWVFLGQLGRPVSPVERILIDEFVFDIVQGQAVDLSGGKGGHCPAHDQGQCQEKFFHGSPLKFGPKSTGRGGIKKAPLITGYMGTACATRGKKILEKSRSASILEEQYNKKFGANNGSAKC